jgi:hypothetical protein
MSELKKKAEKNEETKAKEIASATAGLQDEINKTLKREANLQARLDRLDAEIARSTEAQAEAERKAKQDAEIAK